MKTAIACDVFGWKIQDMTCNRDTNLDESKGCAVRTAMARKVFSAEIEKKDLQSWQKPL